MIRSVCLVHSHYTQGGGEDRVVMSEYQLLKEHGIRTGIFEADNRELLSLGTLHRAQRTLWNWKAAGALKEFVRKEGYQVVHFHNTFPGMSAAVLEVIGKQPLGMVQTLHNHRWFCPDAATFREGNVCLDCIEHRIPLGAVRHACYHGSRLESIGATCSTMIHRFVGQHLSPRCVYVALSEFSRSLFQRAGLPPDRIRVKPNFARDNGFEPEPGNYALFVGRLSKEKGITTLLEAWKCLSHLPLRVVGDGPLAPEVSAAARENRAITWTGWQPEGEVVKLMKGAFVLLVPSQCFENCPLTVAEAFSVGLPVISSDHGALAEMVVSGAAGKRFPAGSAGALRSAVEWLWAHPREARDMRHGARLQYLEKYTPAATVDALRRIYDDAVSHPAFPNPDDRYLPTTLSCTGSPEQLRDL